ncbi:O-acetyltransferase OatA [Pandoraea terrae]|uniref:O-acetyltransferase OatA n=1 Tax=Pandoraea terrae TaxID=1537710 RepID=A0A5E4Y7W2_9BURK|nr:acyltransferase family protein [Pandoraea terrae]VVE44871.1 O-acetyltransferase OatA [Pandoraea terrae]
MPTPSANPYRADIDGLRAIAVLSVILFHVNYRIVPGGFIGVDIFFVISGYLITKIIASEMRSHRFSFKAFYVRRIRRILPVFLLVVAVTLVVGRILLLPEDYLSLLASIRSALLFAANIHFARERNYFDLASDETPLLHVWSLSVEEQFYFVWPVLLLGLFALASSRLVKRKLFARNGMLIAIALMIAIGFTISEWMVRRPGSTSGYYSLFSRFGELLVGAMAAFLPMAVERNIAGCLATPGLVGVAVGLFVIDRNARFPGLLALLPSVSTALILYAGRYPEGTRTLVARLLALPALVSVGLLSYSLYLWHWPVLTFMRYVYGQYSLPVGWNITAIAVMLLLSLLSYELLEKRFKRRKMTFPRAAIGHYATPAALLLTACLVDARISAPAPADPMLASYGANVCHGTLTGHCVRGDTKVAPTVLMIGDSHAAALNAFVDVVGRQEGRSARVVTASSCSPVFDFNALALPDFAQKPCAELTKFVKREYLSYDAILIASYWAFQLGMTDLPTDRNYLEKFGNTLRTLAKARPVYVISDVPRLPVSPFRLARFDRIHFDVDRPFSRKTQQANDRIRKVVESVPNAHWIDLAPELRQFTHGGLFQGKPAYFDEQHLNIYGSTTLGELLTRLGKRLLPAEITAERGSATTQPSPHSVSGTAFSNTPGV